MNKIGRKRALHCARVSGDDSENYGTNLKGQLVECPDYANKMGRTMAASVSEGGLPICNVWTSGVYSGQE